MSVNVEYDYDEVIQFCQGDGQTSICELANSLNSLSEELTLCQDAFHSQNNQLVIGEIYNAFSIIIGSTNSKTGVAGLDIEAANILNVCYSEAMNDKRILESDLSGGGGATLSSSSVPSSNSTVLPDGTVATTENVTMPENMATPPQQEVSTITQTQAPANDATSNASTAAALGLSEAQLATAKAIIRHEAGNNPAEMVNVASAVKNRMNAGNWGGTDPYAVLTAKGQFQSYSEGYYKQYENGNYFQGDAAAKASLDQQINAILLGQQPPTHGYQSFRSSSSENGVQLTEGGNKYR